MGGGEGGGRGLAMGEQVYKEGPRLVRSTGITGPKLGCKSSDLGYMTSPLRLHKSMTLNPKP